VRVLELALFAILHLTLLAAAYGLGERQANSEHTPVDRPHDGWSR